MYIYYIYSTPVLYRSVRSLVVTSYTIQDENVKTPPGNTLFKMGILCSISTTFIRITTLA